MDKFLEVNTTLTKEEAFAEAKRCLGCKKPRCVTGCPASLPIPQFIAALKEEDIDKAYELILQASNLSSVCSRVCDHAKQCIGHCILGVKGTPINVGGLERFVNDYAKYKLQPSLTKLDINVAVIGAGPAGLSCALELVKAGASVTVFEKEKYAGGIVSYGIPEYRLPKAILNKHIDTLVNLGVVFKYESDMANVKVEDLKNQGFDKVVVTVGLTSSKTMRIPNETANGVYDANVLLKDVSKFVSYNEGKEIKLTGRTIVVGAGNVAMDAARTAKRISDGEVMVVYRRTLEEAPASKIEIEEALEEGVVFNFLHNPSEVLVDENFNVVGVKLEKMILGEPDESGRRSPIGSKEYEDIECSNVIVAIGQNPSKDFINVNNITNDYGYIVANELKTNISDVYAGGDIVRGADTVVRSMVDGKKIAQDILGQN